MQNTKAVRVSGYFCAESTPEDVDIKDSAGVDHHMLTQLAENFVSESEVARDVGVELNIDDGVQLVRRAADIMGVILNEPELELPAQIQDDRKLLQRREVIRLRRQGLSYGIIARVTGLSVGAVNATLKVARRHGDTYAHQVGSGRRGRPELLTHGHLLYIKAMIQFHEGETTLREVCAALRANFPELADCSLYTVWRAVKNHLKYSKKLGAARDKRVLKPGRKKALNDYLLEFSRAICMNKEIWSCDESAIWIGRRDSKRWSPVGERVLITQNPRSLTKLTLLLSVSSRGRFFGQLLEGNAATMTFMNYLLALREYIGEEEAVIQLDNASFHRTSLCMAAAKYARLEVIYLPPYFPDGNAIEMVFAIIKRRLYKIPAQDIMEAIRIAAAVMRDISSGQLISCMRKSFKNTVTAAR